MRNRLNHPIAQASRHLAIHKISFRIVHHQWSAVAAMLQAMNVEPAVLLEALKVGHGIEIDVDEDPELFFVLDSEMRQKLHDSNFREPSEAQLIATSRCVAMSEQDAREKFSAQFKGDN